MKQIFITCFGGHPKPGQWCASENRPTGALIQDVEHDQRVPSVNVSNVLIDYVALGRILGPSRRQE
jgi:hypothetical protein